MNSKYINKTHTYGRIWIIVTLALFLCIPALICAHLNVFPKADLVFKGLATVAVVFYPTAILEVLTYSPLLGTGGTYLGFVTGNITNLKLPVALNSMESAEVEPNTEKGEVISTISIAVSSIVTTIIIAVCVLAFYPFCTKSPIPIRFLLLHSNRLLLHSSERYVRHILQSIGRYLFYRLPC